MSTETKQPRTQKRVVVYVPEDEYRQLKAVMALKGTSVSAWFRKKLKEEIEK